MCSKHKHNHQNSNNHSIGILTNRASHPFSGIHSRSFLFQIISQHGQFMNGCCYAPCLYLFSSGIKVQHVIIFDHCFTVLFSCWMCFWSFGILISYCQQKSFTLSSHSHVCKVYDYILSQSFWDLLLSTLCSLHTWHTCTLLTIVLLFSGCQYWLDKHFMCCVPLWADPCVSSTNHCSNFCVTALPFGSIQRATDVLLPMFCSTKVAPLVAGFLVECLHSPPASWWAAVANGTHPLVWLRHLLQHCPLPQKHH